ncbi:MAG: CoA transferase, partial [Burkholderiales bacterium]
SSHVLTAPYQAFRTADGYINIGGANQANWERIADVLGHPEWKGDARFATNADRMRSLPELVAAMEAVLARHDRAHWIGVFDAAGVPVGPVHSIGEALSHPQVLARGMVLELQHPKAGATRVLGCPVHLSETPPRVDRAAPLLGEHTREVLREHGYDDAQIDALAADGVVEEASPAVRTVRHPASR